MKWHFYADTALESEVIVRMAIPDPWHCLAIRTRAEMILNSGREWLSTFANIAKCQILNVETANMLWICGTKSTAKTAVMFHLELRVVLRFWGWSKGSSFDMQVDHGRSLCIGMPFIKWIHFWRCYSSPIYSPKLNSESFTSSPSSEEQMVFRSNIGNHPFWSFLGIGYILDHEHVLMKIIWRYLSSCQKVGWTLNRVL